MAACGSHHDQTTLLQITISSLMSHPTRHTQTKNSHGRAGGWFTARKRQIPGGQELVWRWRAFFTPARIPTRTIWRNILFLFCFFESMFQTSLELARRPAIIYDLLPVRHITSATSILGNRAEFMAWRSYSKGSASCMYVCACARVCDEARFNPLAIIAGASCTKMGSHGGFRWDPLAATHVMITRLRPRRQRRGSTRKYKLFHLKRK